MIICEECVKVLGMDEIKGKRIGAIIKCPVCGKNSKNNFNMKESDIIAFTLQVFRRSIEQQSKKDSSESQ